MDTERHYEAAEEKQCAINPTSKLCDRNGPTLQIPQSSTCRSHTFLSRTQPVSLSELKLIQRRDDSRQTFRPVRPVPHKRDAREDKTRPHQSARNLSSRQCFRPLAGSVCLKRGTWKCNCSQPVLFFSERSRTFYGNTIDVMGDCAGRHLGGPRSPPGGCKKLEETRREVLQCFLPFRRPACRYIILLTICPKAVKAASFS